MAITLNGTTGITTPALDSEGNLEYSGTLTGGTGVLNIGSGQVFKDASGNLLVGTTSQISATSSRVNILNVNEGLSGLTVGNVGGSGNTNCILFANLNGIVGTIRTNGSATSYNTSSDYRLKQNVAPMTGALEKVQALNPVTYNWKVDGSVGQGFIAHELQAVVPDCVTGEKDEVDKQGKPQYQGVDTSFLVGILTAAIQEQQTLIQALTARIEALEVA